MKMKYLLLLTLAISSALPSLTAVSDSPVSYVISREITLLEEQYKLPKGILWAIIQQESHFKPEAINPDTRPGVAVSSFGLGQLTEDTAMWHCQLSKEEIHDPAKNLACAAKVLAYQLKRFKGKADLAISAYNDGTPAICRGGIYVRADNGQPSGTRSGNPQLCSSEGQIRNAEYVTGVTEKWRLVKSRLNKTNSTLASL